MVQLFTEADKLYHNELELISTLGTISRTMRRRFFESAFCKRHSLHGEHFEFRDNRNVTPGVGSGGGGGVLASQKTTGIVGFEEMQLSLLSDNLVPLDHGAIQ